MNYKKITAAITAICLLSVATGATALAAKNIAADTAEDSVVTEGTTEATGETTEESRIVAMSFCEPRSCPNMLFFLRPLGLRLCLL